MKALADGAVRFCANNTGNEEADHNWGETICVSDGSLAEASSNTATPEVQLFVTGTSEFAMMDNIAYQPGRGNWIIHEDGDAPEFAVSPHNNDIWVCLEDGADVDTLSDGCIRIATLNDLNAESTGGFFDDTGKHFYFSVQHNGSYDLLERLHFLRSTFFNKDTTQGPHPIKVKRQGALGEAYSENSRFVKHDIEFVALHIPGNNNNLVVTDDQCFNKSNRTQADCDAATAEYQARNVQNIAWLKEAFAEANSEKYAGVLVAIQADIYFPFELSDGGYQEDFLPQLDANNGYADFFNTLVEETQSFEGKVVLVHGDSHYFKYDKAMYNEDGTLTGNFTRIEVFGNADNSWVEMTVDPSSKSVFSFAPVVLN